MKRCRSFASLGQIFMQIYHKEGWRGGIFSLISADFTESKGKRREDVYIWIKIVDKF